MDKVEYKEKMQEIRRLSDAGDYEGASSIIFQINWKKVKSASTLMHVGIIMGKAGNYHEARELLLSAYDRAPIGRESVYWLTEFAIREKDFKEAQEYFDEYKQISPDDVSRYILEYKLKKARGTDIDILIDLLETIRRKDFAEEWAYQLAYLYHRAGRVNDSIALCDEIILYFGDGPYVERAMELKMLYQPLTADQAAKYEEIMQAKNGKTLVRRGEENGYAEILHQDVSIPTIEENTATFNTIDLQAEIAKNIQQIKDATKKETVDSSMQNIRRIVEESRVPITPTPEEEKLLLDSVSVESEKEIDAALNINFQEMLAQEPDGQMLITDADQEAVQRQITGQLTIEDILNEWDKVKGAAQAAMEDARLRKLESAKAIALAQSEDIMDRIAEVGIELKNAGVKEGPSRAERAAMMQKAEESFDKEETIFDETALGDITPLSASQAFMAAGVPLEPIVPDDTVSDPALSDAAPIEPESAAEPAIREPMAHTEPEAQEPTAPAAPSIADIQNEINDYAADLAKVSLKKDDDVLSGATKRIPDIKDNADDIPNLENAIEAQIKDDIAEMIEPEAPEDEFEDLPPIMNLNDEQKTQMGFFTSIAGMEKQTCSVLEGVRNRRRKVTSNSGNIVVIGESGCGKTTLAGDIIKLIRDMYPHSSNTVGKVSAESLNKKDILDLLQKIAGGYLIIEQAGLLKDRKKAELAESLKADTRGTLVILEDTDKGIKRALTGCDEMARKFTESIRIPMLTNDELVEFAKKYANDENFVMDELAVLALYNSIGNIRTGATSITLSQICEIMNDAMDHSKKGGAIRSMLSKREDSEGRVILKEKDFR